RKNEKIKKFGINKTKVIFLSHSLYRDSLTKKKPKNITHQGLIAIIYGFYRVFIYQIFFYLARRTGKMYL
ncbi:hypothetical protein, partial [Citrobacter freundii]|uniref:hypothetical protein n=1 Tax=Citrobacter freundii TaxID=546 RepID=UPI001CD5DFAD